jgi:N-methylhydantoinase A
LERADAEHLSIAVDIGGTFTDLVAFDAASGRIIQGKSLTTHGDLPQGVWDCFGKGGLAPRDAANVVHGSTIAINIAIEETGAKTALVVTRGTRDVYKIGRQNRPQAYNFDFRRPVPLVPRSRTYEVAERMSADGRVLLELDAAEAAEVAATIRASGAEAVAVCFLHSYLDPGHEVEMGRHLRAALADAYVSLSHEIVREYREYERTSTTVMNAYIGPETSAYVGRMQTRLEQDHFAGRFLIMQSNGGVMSPETAKRLPVAMMESGPVGGVIAAAAVGEALGHRNLITFDMGGTTAKTSLIKDGEVSITQGYHIGGYASGHPVMFPVVDIVEVGAGGGSIAWIDDVGALKIGPQSAGSAPGPICYGRGGTQPTVTDANVVLGRIGAERFLGGEMPLDQAAARTGIETHLARPLGLGVDAAALGVVRIAVAKMSLAVRGISVERGYDPRDFALVAIGGAGPLHALEIARDLKIPRVIVPNLPAHFSALGMLLADVRHDYVRTYYRPLLEADFGALESIYAELRTAGETTLDDAGVEGSARRFALWMDLRYVGQEFWLQIPVTEAEIAQADAQAIGDRYTAIHDRRFGHAAPDEPLELVNLRLTAIGTRPKVTLPPVAAGSASARIGTRAIYLEDAEEPVECTVYKRELLTRGTELEGPCVVEEYASTTVLFAGDRLHVADTGELVIDVRTDA